MTRAVIHLSYDFTLGTHSLSCHVQFSFNEKLYDMRALTLLYEDVGELKLNFSGGSDLSPLLSLPSPLICFRSAAPSASCVVRSMMPWTTDHWPPPVTKRP